MSKSIALIDYGMGNLKSVRHAFEYFGADVELVEHGRQLNGHQLAILPGVGAFGDGMKELRERQFIEALKSHIESGKKIFGICLGMQMLFESSTEFGFNQGLGFLRGKFEIIPKINQDGGTNRVPFVGWSELEPQGDNRATFSQGILKSITAGSAVYFVHSYFLKCYEESNVIACTTYNGLKIPALVQRDNIFGCQFHPEKSGPVGLEIIKNLMKLI